MKMELVRGDITRLKVAAIVNAANSRLMGGGGVDGAIHRAAGPKLLKDCQNIFRQQGECPAGSAVLTPGYQLHARFVIHAVGPIWRDGDNAQDEILGRAYQSSLQLACAAGCESLAFPCISTGVYRFPKSLAAPIALAAITDFLDADNTAVLQKIQLVCFDEENYEIYRALLA